MEDKKNPDVPIRKWLRCPNCTWTSFRYRPKSKDYYCMHCGSTFTADYDNNHTKLVQIPVFNGRKKR